MNYLSGPSSVASLSQCSSIQSPPHLQSPMHQSHYQQLNPNQQLTAGSSKSFYQYLTPPSHNDIGNHTPPQHLVQTLDSYPTPSPESPHWSSSQSPHSISDWSETQSPSANQNHYSTNGVQTNKGSAEAIYI